MVALRFIFLQVGLAVSLLGEDRATSVRPVETVPALIEPGDLVFREGTGWRSATVQARGNFVLSHVGIADRSSDGAIVIIHADPGEGSLAGSVRAEPYASFADPSRSRGLAVYRLSLSQRAKSQMLARARSFAARQLPFDYDFNLEDEKSLYCTELVWRSMQGQHLSRFTTNVALLNSRIMFPKDLLKSIPQKTLIQRIN